MGGLNFGYNTGVIAGILGIWSGGTDTNWHLSSGLTGIVTASILIGALLGSVIGGPISDTFGRRVGVLVLAVITLIGAPVLAICPTYYYVIIARAFLGIGVGMSGVICPMYVSETAPPQNKGALGTLFQLAITLGILFAYIINYALETAEYNWRIMFGLGAFPGLFLLMVWWAMPESPVWALKRGGGFGEEAPLIRTNEAALTLSDTPVKGPQTLELLRPPPHLALSLTVRIGIFLRSRALYIGLVLAMAQQLTGINAFMYYAKDIFGSAGINNENYPTMGLGAWNALTTMLAIPLVDRLGRRPLLVFGTMVMTIACFGLGAVYSYANGDEKGYLAIILLFIFVLAFEVGDGPLFWIVAHELFTPEIKTVGASTLNAAQWLFNIMLTLGFPAVKEAIGAPVFYIFGGVGAVCTLILIIFLPETRNNPHQRLDA